MWQANGRSGLPSSHPSPASATAFTHLGLRGRWSSDSLRLIARERSDGDGRAGAVWRPPPGKRGAFLHGRLVARGAEGVRIRRLGGDRAGEIRVTRFLRNEAVTCQEIFSV